MAVLEVQGLVAGYEDAAVVRNLSLTIGKGEVVVLLGPNGAGKTTTLQAISGLVQVMSGSLRLNSEDSWSIPPRNALARASRMCLRDVASLPDGKGEVPDNGGVLVASD